MDPTLALYEKLKSVQLQGTFPHLASHGITSLHALKKLTLNDYASKAGLNDTEKVEILFNLIQQLKKDTEKSTEINSEEFNNKPGSVGSSINTLASANSTTLVPSVAAPTGLRPPSATVLKNKLISSLAASLLESDLTTSSIVSENTISSNIPLSLSSHAIREPFKSATKAVIKSPIKTNNVKSPSHIRSTSNIKSPSHIRSTSGTSVELKTPPKLATNMTITTNNPNLKSPVTGHKYVAVKSPSGNTAGSSRMHRRSVSATLNAYGIAESNLVNF